VRKEHPYRFWWPALLTAGLLLSAGCANAETTMTVTGPVVTTGDYISNGTDVLEKRWRYDITNTSSSGDTNNMIEFQINEGSDNDVMALTKTYSGTGTINLSIANATSGFTGLLPFSTSPFNNNKVIF
jgi:hypothetical protein